MFQALEIDMRQSIAKSDIAFMLSYFCANQKHEERQVLRPHQRRALGAIAHLIFPCCWFFRKLNELHGELVFLTLMKGNLYRFRFLQIELKNLCPITNQTRCCCQRPTTAQGCKAQEKIMLLSKLRGG